MQQPIAIAVVMLLGLWAPGDGICSTPESSTQSQRDGEAARQVRYNAHILVDQFGYRPTDTKVAVIRDPRKGYDAGEHFSAGKTYQVRRASDGAVVYDGSPAIWNGGATEASSGDRGWWFDFSPLNTAGTYYVFDPANAVRSATFRVAPDVYRDVLKAALRMYFYQRSGFAKRRPYAALCWIDDPAYTGPGQDSQAHDITDRDNRAKIRDLSGGWFDAGDTNKYVTFASQPVHQLLTAYQQNPQVFGDDFNLPESGNGIPDILDEVAWETAWLKKMQYDDGSVALKVGEIIYTAASPPSSDHTPRFYIPACTSATIAAAGMFAHAAYVFSRFPALASEAGDLKTRALAAWKNYQGNPGKQLHCDTGVVHAGNADLTAADQDAEAVTAAIYLFAATGDSAYGDYVRANYRNTRPYHDFGWSRYKPEQGDALLFYTTLANADPALKKTLLADKLQDAVAGNHIYGFVPEDDLYRAYLHDAQYHWGSNNPRASYGNTNLDLLDYDIGVSSRGTYQARALEILHYFHGVNPLGKVYLSNMYSYGATDSINEIFHVWYRAGTRWSDARTSPCGPAPGYVPGGPVANATGIPANISPPAGQPEQKSYRDWNGEWPDASYIVNEPAIYYQSAYLKLLAHFAQ